jgi:hypothetical protein
MLSQVMNKVTPLNIVPLPVTTPRLVAFCWFYIINFLSPMHNQIHLLIQNTDKFHKLKVIFNTDIFTRKSGLKCQNFEEFLEVGHLHLVRIFISDSKW